MNTTRTDRDGLVGADSRRGLSRWASTPTLLCSRGAMTTGAMVKLCSMLYCAVLYCSSVLYSAEPIYRTDADGNEKLPWFEPKPGEFPSAGSSHYIAGELIAVDHINRTGALRIDRTDAIRRSEWDHSLSFTLLSYGSLSYHGAPAELKDIPIGTHLHGQFFSEEKTGKSPQPVFNRAIRLEDDFSFCAAAHRAWRVDTIDVEKGTFTVTGITSGKADPKATAFQICAATMVW